MSEFSGRLTKQRKAVGLTQEALGDAIGYRKQAISNYENGHNEPDYQTLCKIADALSCTTDYLLGRDHAPTHEAASVVQQTGLSAEAVEVLRNNTLLMESDPYNDFEHKAVLDFISALICSEYLNPISMRYLSWKDAIKEQIEEYAKYETEMAEYFDSHGDAISPIPKEKYIERDEKGEFVGYTIDFLEKAKEWNKQTLSHLNGEMAIEGRRYSVIRVFESFLTEQSETGPDNKESEE